MTDLRPTHRWFWLKKIEKNQHPFHYVTVVGMVYLKQIWWQIVWLPSLNKTLQWLPLKLLLASPTSPASTLLPTSSPPPRPQDFSSPHCPFCPLCLEYLVPHHLGNLKKKKISAQTFLTEEASLLPFQAELWPSLHDFVQYPGLISGFVCF